MAASFHAVKPQPYFPNDNQKNKNNHKYVSFHAAFKKAFENVTCDCVKVQQLTTLFGKYRNMRCKRSATTHKLACP